MADAEVEKPDWPQTPDGTIDWETVFEDPESGIIPALSAATTKDVLHKGTVAVVKQLFTRKNDEIQVEAFLKELNYILKETDGSEDLPKMQESVINLLRRIKDGRVEKAAAYVTLKKKEAADDAIKQRKKEKRRLGGNRRSDDSQKKSATLIGLMVAAVLMAIVAFLLLYMVFVAEDTPPDESEVEPAPLFESEPPSEPEEPEIDLSDEGYPLGKMDPDTVANLGPTVMILKRFFWSGEVEGGREGGTPLVPVLIIKDEDAVSRICDFGPNLIDALNLALGRTITGDDKASPDDLRAAGLVALETVNKRLGKRWIRDIHLLYDVDARLLAMSSKCQIMG